MPLYGAMRRSASGAARRDSRATTRPPLPPVAPCPLVVGVLRCLEVATVLARRIPPQPAPGLSCGRGVAAVGLAILAGPQALSQVGRRRADRGRWTRRPPGLTRTALHAARLGPRRAARWATHRTQGFGALARTALAGEARPPPGAPPPAAGPRPAGRDALPQGRLCLGGRGAGGRALRRGRRAGPRRARVATPLAMEAGLALGGDRGRGAAARQAERRRPLG
jgi:hypothetical protein